MLKVIVGNASAITVDAVVCACRSASENNPDYIVADCECRGVQSPTTSGLSVLFGIAQDHTYQTLPSED
jgi:hypothetical protein